MVGTLRAVSYGTQIQWYAQCSWYEPDSTTETDHMRSKGYRAFGNENGQAVSWSDGAEEARKKYEASKCDITWSTYKSTTRAGAMLSRRKSAGKFGLHRGTPMDVDDVRPEWSGVLKQLFLIFSLSIMPLSLSLSQLHSPVFSPWYPPLVLWMLDPGISRRHSHYASISSLR